jgi:hypothetical protein
MEGPYLESATKTVEFINMEPDAFVRLSQFAYKGDYTAPSKFEAKDDLTAILLGHAQVYCTADQYDISALGSLALSNLSTTLDADDHKKYGFEPVFELVRYVYGHTREDAAEPLRKLSVDYVAKYIDEIGGSDDFALLLAEGGDFVIDFWKMLWNSPNRRLGKKNCRECGTPIHGTNNYCVECRYPEPMTTHGRPPTIRIGSSSRRYI